MGYLRHYHEKIRIYRVTRHIFETRPRHVTKRYHSPVSDIGKIMQNFEQLFEQILRLSHNMAMMHRECPSADGLGGKRLVIWGTGGHYRSIYAGWLASWVTEIPYIAFVDNDPGKWGSRVDGHVVYAPHELISLQPDCVIIASFDIVAIFRQLKEIGYSGALWFPFGIIPSCSHETDRDIIIKSFRSIAAHFAENLQGCDNPALYNEFINEIEMMYRPEVLLSYPKFVSFALANFCNAKCITCGTSSNPPYALAMQDVVNMHFLKYAKHIQFNYGISDPLAHPDACRIIEYVNIAHKPRAITMITNGIGLAKGDTVNCLAENLTSISISLNATNEHEWEKIFCVKGGYYQKIADSISALCKLKSLTGNRLNSVSLTMIAFENSLKYIKEFIRQAHALGVDHIGIIDYIPNNRRGVTSHYNHKSYYDKCKNEAIDLAESLNINISGEPLFREKYFVSGYGRKKYDPNSDYQCVEPWSSLYLLQNSENIVHSPCCASVCAHQPKFTMSDELFKEKIWNSARYRYLRRAVAQGYREPACWLCNRSAIADPFHFHQASPIASRFASGFKALETENMVEPVENYMRQNLRTTKYLHKRAASRAAVYDRIFFLVGGKMSGADELAAVLSRADNAVVLHEPLPEFGQEARLHLEGHLEYPEHILEETLFPRAVPICREGKLYGENSWALFSFIKPLHKRYHARFIHVTRDGRESVALMRAWHGAKGTCYREGTKQPLFCGEAAAHIANVPVENDVINFSLPRPMPDDSYFERWPSMTHHEMLCWHWNFVNTFILEQLRAVPEHCRVHFDASSLNSGAEINKVVSCLRLEGVSPSTVVGLNAYDADWKNWTSEEQEQFWAICGDTMKELGYAEL